MLSLTHRAKLSVTAIPFNAPMTIWRPLLGHVWGITIFLNLACYK